MMEVLLRAVAIFIEVVILAAVIYCLFSGMRLTLFDLGLGPKYRRMVAVFMLMVGCLVVVFFIAHLTLFYPVVGAGQ